MSVASSFLCSPNLYGGFRLSQSRPYLCVSTTSEFPAGNNSSQDSQLRAEADIKFYRYYYTEASANDEMSYPTGTSLHDFLRGYFYLKSTARTDLATMPLYYTMPID
jgi:hypothetical protein